jgi:hypothetical protein
MIGVEVITCAEALGIIQTAKPSSTPAYTRQNQIKTENVPRQEDVETDMNKKFNIFEFNSILRAAGVLIPSDVLVSVFVRANAKATKGQSTDDCFCSFSLADIDQIMEDDFGADEDITIKAMKAVAMDSPSVLYFSGGLLLLIGLFPIPVAVTNITGLLVIVFYILARGQSVIMMPLNDWEEMVHVESNVRKLKESIRKESMSYDSEKMNDVRTYVRATSVEQQVQYIREVIYSGDPDALTKSEVEMLLLRELGTSYSQRTLDYIILFGSRTTNPRQDTFATPGNNTNVSQHFKIDYVVINFYLI